MKMTPASFIGPPMIRPMEEPVAPETGSAGSTPWGGVSFVCIAGWVSHVHYPIKITYHIHKRKSRGNIPLVANMPGTVTRSSEPSEASEGGK